MCALVHCDWTAVAAATGSLLQAGRLLLSSRDWEPKIKVPATQTWCLVGGSFLLQRQLSFSLSSHGRRDKGAFSGLFCKGTNLIYESSTLLTNSPPSAPPANPSPWRLDFNIRMRDPNTESTAAPPALQEEPHASTPALQMLKQNQHWIQP